MELPFISGVSLSSFNIPKVFLRAPKVVVSEERAQGRVAILYPKGSPKNTGTEDEQDDMDRQYRKYTDHLQELWREQGAEGSYEEWLVEHCSKWCCWAETWLSELRQLREGYLFVFVTPEDDKEYDGPIGPCTAEQLVSGADVLALRDGEYESATVQGSSEKREGQVVLKFEDGKLLAKSLDEIINLNTAEPSYKDRTNRQSFETKFKSKMYTEGKIDHECSSTKGSFMSGRAWCKEHCFDTRLGFADEGWGFAKGEKASGILDWERRHLASVSKKHGLQTVFISTAPGWDCTVLHDEDVLGTEIMVQVARPAWYPYDGLEAPLSTFVYTRMDTGYSLVQRMVPAEEAELTCDTFSELEEELEDDLGSMLAAKRAELTELKHKAIALKRAGNIPEAILVMRAVKAMDIAVRDLADAVAAGI
jgi:hypothetical protein